ncbi:DUF2516 family protein [Actinotalea sp. K2]|uniref:DUF2516 family protein n=1 Tax=Actinotalea sp. K2 TaxID=2939438 RepID=UPI0020181681|nr:DUF2516 family protein [Actinotalea sp. K2]MCL3859533.1 DUF2516 family protein [Actinotalea sp. K2]
MIRSVQLLVFLVLYLAVFATCVVALVDVLRRPPAAFVSAGKRTKGFWLGVTVAATAVSFVAIPYPLGIGALGFLAIVGAVAAIVYLVDVKPAVAPYSGRRGPGDGPRGTGW